MECDVLGHHPHIALETVKPDTHIVKMILHQIFNRWVRPQKAFKGSFHDHALADARAVGCDVKPVTECFGKPNGHLSLRQRTALAGRRHGRFDVDGLVIGFAVELHVLVFLVRQAH